ncbi:hypothetical protein [Cellulomonas sp. SLBN-39]|uniref:hypothetical protein n=1 Tax=Cellulomonas sp. SLBN-39 TaxID=2768446 RepID=UPI00114EE0BC|nr:hypothetical protein [Cellulomonas sp. SLBN-39]
MAALSLLMLGPSVASAADSPGFWSDSSESEGPGTSVAPEASGGAIAVTVTSSGSTVEGESFSRSVRSSVVPACWMAPGPTGAEYYEEWKPGSENYNSGTLDSFAAQGLLHKDFEQYATDTEGRWYEAECRFEAPGEVRTEYYLSHPAVFVPAGEPAPAVDVYVDPGVLAQIASENMSLPAGTVRWNPSLEGSGATVVNVDTWVWVEGASERVEVTASVPGVSATVTAVLAGMRVEAPGAGSVRCADAGRAWVEGASDAGACAVVFERSTAGLGVKEGQVLPTVTLSATAVWEASWTSNLDPGPHELDVQSVTTTGEVPVAEIQTIVTG